MREAEAVPGAKSAFDQYYMSEFRGYAYHNLRQDADAARELEAALNSPCMPEAKKADRYKSLVGLYTSLKNYPKAIDYGNRALKLSARSGDPGGVGAGLLPVRQQQGSRPRHERGAAESRASGQAPKEQQLLLVRAACERPATTPA